MYENVTVEEEEQRSEDGKVGEQEEALKKGGTKGGKKGQRYRM
jgi:hypothetical protein